MMQGKTKRPTRTRLWRVFGTGASVLAIVLVAASLLTWPGLGGTSDRGVGGSHPEPVAADGSTIAVTQERDSEARSAALPKTDDEQAAGATGAESAASAASAAGADSADAAAGSTDASESEPGAGPESASKPESASPSDNDAPRVSRDYHVPSVADIPDEEVPSIAMEHDGDVVLAQFAPSATIDDVNAALAQADGIRAQQVTAEDMERGFVKLRTNDGVSAELALAQLRDAPVLRHVQPNYRYVIADDGLDNADEGWSSGAGGASIAAKGGVPGGIDVNGGGARDGALVAQDIALDDDDGNIWKQWALNSVNAFEAWDLANVEDEGARAAVTVAVIDNGVFVDHEDLKDNIVDTYNAVEGGKDKGKRDEAKVKDVSPEFGSHGTHVAGIIAAVADNGIGVAGVSYNARLLPIQVFKRTSRGSSGASSEDIAQAYSYLLANASKDADGDGRIETVAEEYNVRVANMSLGVEVLGGEEDIDDEDHLVVDKVKDAHEAGILTVCSAGNDADRFGGAYNNFPSDWLEESLGVIALAEGPPVSILSYSNYNMKGQRTKDLAAPGRSILSTEFGYKADGSGRTSSYGYNSGTSMASPCVAGIAALVSGVNTELDADDVAQLLCNTASDLGAEGWDETYGAGEVNAARAVAVAKDSVFLEGRKSLFVEQSGAADDGIDGGSGDGGGNGTAGTEADDEGSYRRGATTTQLVPMMGGKRVEGSWAWESSDSDVAIVSDDGTVTGVGPGTAVITATCSRNAGNGSDGETAETLTGKKTVTVYDVSYSGPHEVAVFSSIDLTFHERPDTGRWIIDITDSSIAEISDVPESDLTKVVGRNVGEADVTADLSSGAGLGYTHHIKVVPASFDDLHLKIEGIDNLVYTGAAVEPVPTVSCGDYTLVKGVDFDVAAYDNNVNIGKASLTIKGKGNFKGTKTVNFNIAKPNLANATVSLSGWTYDGADHKPEVTVKIGKQTLQKSLYAVSYSGNRDAGTCTATVTSANERYCTGTAKGTCTVSPRSIASASISGLSSVTYTGKKLTPEPAVSVGALQLAKSRDYTLSYKNNVNAGTATVTVKGVGNYTGVKSASFSIKRMSLAKASISKPASRAYTGKAYNPAPTVRIGSTTLARNRDYTLSYKNNVKAGVATVTVTGKGNYAGAARVSYRITKAANPLKVKAVAKSVKYAKLKKRAQTVSGAIKFTVRAQGTVTYAKVAKGSSAKLTVAKKTGKVTVKKGTKKGVYKIKLKVTAKGNANYASGSRTVTVKIRVK